MWTAQAEPAQARGDSQRASATPKPHCAAISTAKTRARLLSSIPMASRGTQVFLLDLHVATIAHYFEGGIRPIHMYGKSLVTAAARRLP